MPTQKWIIYAVVVVVGVLLFVMRARAAASRSQEAHRAVEQGALVLDVRTPEEFSAGHLPGAINIPVQELAGRTGELRPGQAGIVVYCRSGARSHRAEQLLREKGFDKIIDLGPMGAW